MEWFSEWWNSLIFAEQIMFCIAIPATLILIIQTIMVCLGFGHGGEGIDFSDTSGIDGLDGGLDGGMDVGGDITDISEMPTETVSDGGNPADFTSMKLFTFQGIIAFLCVFSWVSLIGIRADLYIVFALLIGFVLGIGAMIGVAKIIQLSARLAQNGNFNIKNTLGEIGTAYTPIPAGKNGYGKITISVGERFLEFEAVTESESMIPSNAKIRVTDVINGNTLVVEKAD